MPVKDLTGPPRRTEEEEALLIEMHRRMGKPWAPRQGPPDPDGMEPATPPTGPKPMPLAGAAVPDEDA